MDDYNLNITKVWPFIILYKMIYIIHIIEK